MATCNIFVIWLNFPEWSIFHLTNTTNYDIDNINNICNNLPISKYKGFEIDDVIDICKNAYKNTIEKDKTINIEAFVDNLAKEFTKERF